MQLLKPLIAPAAPLSSLTSEYTSTQFIAKLNWLVSHGWTGLRRSRGDGDCFYRSVAYAYVERILNAPDLPLAVATSLSRLEMRLSDLRAAGFEPLVVRILRYPIISIQLTSSYSTKTFTMC